MAVKIRNVSPLVVGRSDTNDITNVGIGHNDPQYQLVISRLVDAPKYQLNFNTEGATSINNYGGILFTQGSGTPVQLAAIKLIHKENTTADISFDTKTVSGALYIKADGGVGVGTDSVLNNFSAGSVATKFAVVTSSTGSGYHEAVHIAAGSDSDDTGAILRLGHYGNDRGLYVKAGRGSSDRAIARFGLRDSNVSDNDVLTLAQEGASYRVGIGTGTNTLTRKLEIHDTQSADIKLVSENASDFTLIANSVGCSIYEETVGYHLTVAAGGNVGIGTGSNAPDYTLDVNGTIRTTTLRLGSETVTATSIKDEDDMASDSNTALATQQSIKAYVDAEVTAQDLDFTTDTAGNSSVDLDSEILTLSGGEGMDVTHSGQTITIAGEDASLTNKGIASFDDTFFSASSGAISLDAAQVGITSVLNTALAIGRDADNLIDFSTDNRIVFNTNGAHQIALEDGVLRPITDDDIDLGTSTLEFKDLYLDGTANIDSLVADTADINGGTIDGAAINSSSIGATTASTGDFTTLTASSTLDVTGIAKFADKVGIGTGSTAPDHLLTIHGDGGNTYIKNLVKSNHQVGIEFNRTETPTPNPSYNTNWIQYIPASSTDLRFYNGSDRVTFAADGKVGIGTGSTAPSKKLEINAGDILLSNIGLNKYGLLFGEGANQTMGLRYDGTGSDGNLEIVDSSNNLLVNFEHDGKVGIGTGANTPLAKLDVRNDDGVLNGFHIIADFNRSGSADAQLILGYEADGTNVIGPLIYAANSRPLSFWTNGNKRLEIAADGKVGVGTGSSVDTILHVKASEPVLKVEATGTDKHSVLNLAAQGTNTGLAKIQRSGVDEISIDVNDFVKFEKGSLQIGQGPAKVDDGSGNMIDNVSSTLPGEGQNNTFHHLLMLEDETGKLRRTDTVAQIVFEHPNVNNASAPADARRATASAIIKADGTLVGVRIVDPGKGYDSSQGNIPTVELKGGGGEGAVLSCTTNGTTTSVGGSDDGITWVYVNNKGSGYHSVGMIKPEKALEVSDILETNITNWEQTGVSALTPSANLPQGAGYQTPPLIKIGTSWSSGLSVSVGDRVANDDINSNGYKFLYEITQLDNVSVTGNTAPSHTAIGTVVEHNDVHYKCVGPRAEAEAIIDGGEITQIAITEAGDGYGSAPTVVIDDTGTSCTTCLVADLSFSLTATVGASLTSGFNMDPLKVPFVDTNKEIVIGSGRRIPQLRISTKGLITGFAEKDNIGGGAGGGASGTGLDELIAYSHDNLYFDDLYTRTVPIGQPNQYNDRVALNSSTSTLRIYAETSIFAREIRDCARADVNFKGGGTPSTSDPNKKAYGIVRVGTSQKLNPQTHDFPGITLLNGGTDYQSAPTVEISLPEWRPIQWTRYRLNNSPDEWKVGDFSAVDVSGTKKAYECLIANSVNTSPNQDPKDGNNNSYWKFSHDIQFGTFGTAATATCTISNGVVNAVTITEDGDGYFPDDRVALLGDQQNVLDKSGVPIAHMASALRSEKYVDLHYRADTILSSADNSTNPGFTLTGNVLSLKVADDSTSQDLSSIIPDTITTIQRGSNDNIHYLTFVDSNDTNSTSNLAYTDGGLKYNPASNLFQVGGDIHAQGDFIGNDDLYLRSDGAQIFFGADDEVYLKHVHNTGLLLGSSRQLQFRDAGLTINSSADGQLDIDADVTLQITAPTVDIDASTEVNISNALKVTGATTLSSNLVVNGEVTITPDAGTNGESLRIYSDTTDNQIQMLAAAGDTLRLGGNNKWSLDLGKGTLGYDAIFRNALHLKDTRLKLESTSDVINNVTYTGRFLKLITTSHNNDSNGNPITRELKIGAGDGGWMHFYTDAPQYYFSNDVYVNGEFYIYDDSGTLTYRKVWHEGNLTPYSHPTGDGNKHVPATGTGNNGKVLTAGSTAGSLSWTNKYSHPTGDGSLHVPATGTGNNGKVLTAGSTAGSLSWKTPSGDFVSKASGGTFTGKITISTTSPILILKDSNSTGNAHTGYIRFADKDNKEKAWMGFGSSGTDDIGIKNNYSGGHIVLTTTGAGKVFIGSNTINTAAYKAVSYFAAASHKHAASDINTGTFSNARFNSGTHYTNINAGKLDGIEYTGFLRSTSTASQNHYIRNASPTIYFRDTNHRSAMIHVNNSRFYILRGSGNDSTSWTKTNNHWPLEINLDNNDATFGRNLSAVGNISASNLSGTNTGDQTLPTRDSLGIDTNDTVTFAGLRVTGTGVGALQVDKLEPYSNGVSEWIGYTPISGVNRYVKGQVGGPGTTAASPVYKFGYFKQLYGLFNPYSDERMKMDIKPTSIGLDFLRALTINTYKMRDSETPRTKVGFIAQDIEKALESTSIESPSFINVPEYDKNPDYLKAVDATQLLSVCINAIKQLDAKVQELEAKLEEK